MQGTLDALLRGALGALSALGLSACQETIALGSDCPPLGRRCVRYERPMVEPDSADGGGASPVDDAGGAPVPSTDAGAPFSMDDGGEPAGPLPDLAPAFVNPSFELAEGAPEGRVFPLVRDTSIAPWNACTGAVGARHAEDLRINPSGEPSPADLLYPSDGEALVSLAFGLTGFGTVFQRLAEPLVEGQHYAFAIDVVSTGNAAPRLELRGTNGVCVRAERLDRSRPIAQGKTWQTLCFSFDAPAAYERLLLQSVAFTGTRLFVDNLRNDASCR